MVARQLYREFFEFKPTAHFVLFTNHKPRIYGTDEGIWRRVREVPFDYNVPPTLRDKKLEAKLKAERSGILNWMVEGAIDWMKYGMIESETVRVSTENYRMNEDPVADFLLERCVTNKRNARISPTDLYNNYAEWSYDRKTQPLKRPTFFSLMEDRGYKRLREGSKTVVVGIALLTDDTRAEAASTDF